MLVNIKKRKFVRNVIIGIIALMLVAFVINLAPGYERNKFKDVINLVVRDENVTENMQNPIYKDETGKMYISTVDIQNFIDETIFIDDTNDIITENEIIYVPIEKLEKYNIEVNYVAKTNIIIIDKLNEGMIQAKAYEDTIIRYKQRALSKEVGTLKKGEIVSAFYTTSKGWRLIRTEDGTIGYVKANKLTNEQIVRQDTK